jgi:hypothetical protein
MPYTAYDIRCLVYSPDASQAHPRYIPGISQARLFHVSGNVEVIAVRNTKYGVPQLGVHFILATSESIMVHYAVCEHHCSTASACHRLGP